MAVGVAVQLLQAFSQLRQLPTALQDLTQSLLGHTASANGCFLVLKHPDFKAALAQVNVALENSSCFFGWFNFVGLSMHLNTDVTCTLTCA